MAVEAGEADVRESRKSKGLRLLEFARRLSQDDAAARAPAAAGSHDARGGPAAGESPPAESRWEVVQKPGISFADIAGLTEVKDLILRRVLLPFRNPQLAEAYRRKPGGGVLMFGPPGTGKTMMGKAVATELDAPFFNVRCSDIMSKWVGEAEGNVKSLFQAARAKLPAVLFFDETEALFSRRGSQASVMDRVVPEFLAQIDGLQHGSAGLLLLGATNRPWDIDPAALRPGRFGERVYIGLPDRPARQLRARIDFGKGPLRGRRRSGRTGRPDRWLQRGRSQWVGGPDRRSGVWAGDRGRPADSGPPPGY